MMSASMLSYACPCKNPKTHCMVFDGGPAGIYKVELCDGCYLGVDKKFLVSEEDVRNTIGGMDE